MKLISLEKKHQGKYLSYYEATYLLENNKRKKYEFTSRDSALSMEKFGKGKPQGVGMVVYSESLDKVLLQAEFRLATNNFVYNFPAGLIDKDETPEETAKREMKEETGLNLDKVIDVLPPSFASPGTSDEMMYIVICTAKGEIKESIFAEEEIHAKWYTKEEVRELIHKGAFMSVRTQMFLYEWSKN